MYLQENTQYIYCSVLYSFRLSTWGLGTYLPRITGDYCSIVYSQKILQILSVLVFWDSCNKVPQAGWLRITEIYFSLFRRLGNRNQGLGRAMFPLKHTGESFLASSQLLVFIVNLWCFGGCRQIIPLLSLSSHGILSVYLCLHFPSYQDTSDWFKVSL